MGSWGSKKKKATSFKSSVEAAAAVLQAAQERAVTTEELKAVADGWLALVTELNPSNVFKDDKDD